MNVLKNFVISLLLLAVLPIAAEQQTGKIPASKTKTVAPTVAQNQPKPANEKLMVYYFRNNRRCPSCIRIEKFSHAAVDEGFTADVKNGRVEWKMVNIEDPGNEFYADKYQIFTKTVILSSLKDGKETKWTNLDKIWDLLGDEQVFKDYIQKGIRDFLAEK